MQQKRRSARDADSDGSTAQAGDHAFIAGLRDGDVATFRQLLERYWRPLVAYAYRMLNSQDAAEDAVQEAFIRLWQHRSETRPHHSLRAYLFGMVRNVASDARRQGRVREHAPNLTEEETLKSFSVMQAIMGITGLVVILVAAKLIPLI